MCLCAKGPACKSVVCAKGFLRQRFGVPKCLCVKVSTVCVSTVCQSSPYVQRFGDQPKNKFLSSHEENRHAEDGVDATATTAIQNCFGTVSPSAKASSCTVSRGCKIYAAAVFLGEELEANRLILAVPKACSNGDVAFRRRPMRFVSLKGHHIYCTWFYMFLCERCAFSQGGAPCGVPAIPTKRHLASDRSAIAPLPSWRCLRTSWPAWSWAHRHDQLGLAATKTGATCCPQRGQTLLFGEGVRQWVFTSSFASIWWGYQTVIL